MRWVGAVVPYYWVRPDAGVRKSQVWMFNRPGKDHRELEDTVVTNLSDLPHDVEHLSSGRFGTFFSHAGHKFGCRLAWGLLPSLCPPFVHDALSKYPLEQVTALL